MGHFHLLSPIQRRQIWTRPLSQGLFSWAVGKGACFLFLGLPSASPWATDMNPGDQVGLGEGCWVPKAAVLATVGGSDLASDLATLGGKTFSQFLSYFSCMVVDFQIQLKGH